jgi:antitoxin component YwqK of YwqJK toxin-antitoxin module
MALEEIASRIAALRNEYALGLDYIPAGELPKILVPYYEEPWRVEIHVLYKNGDESRRQWIFRDPEGMSRLVAVFDQDLLNPPADETTPAADGEESGGNEAAAGAAETEGPAEMATSAAEAEVPAEMASGTAEAETGTPETETAELAAVSEPPGRILTGFIELYNEEGRIIREYLFLDGGEENITEYVYRSQRLVRAEMRRKILNDGEEEIVPVLTDLYRYSRSASLRAVERTYHEGAETSPVFLRFPHMILDAAAEDNFISPGRSYGTEFPGDHFIGTDYRIVYTTDERGRVLTETRMDGDGNTIGELKNTWSGDRLVSVSQKNGDEERLTEYTYDSGGNRIMERNYRNGSLERVVRMDDGKEVEELYMNGTIILRAIWEDGRKISEERVRPE